eukprot:NODE_1158_length_1546_cov_8.076152_g960_i0.p1 GENE.NODE_1158_length_1546_cov_8.076152_g960_i0~~NODE_1158_length_1546_cov_8.076152_g960_i0.p1  ORF type:complete len:345 (+),score=65.81 NODE_1158_length_1546_cov_8.076152_g960_i0:436-1470(+)
MPHEGRVRLRRELKVLKVIIESCGGVVGEKRPVSEIQAMASHMDMAQLSEYERMQFTSALALDKIREDIKDLAQMKSEELQERISLKNSIRSQLSQLSRQTDSREFYKLAQKEGRVPDLLRLKGFVQKTNTMFRQQSQGGHDGLNEAHRATLLGTSPNAAGPSSSGAGFGTFDDIPQGGASTRPLGAGGATKSLGGDVALKPGSVSPSSSLPGEPSGGGGIYLTPEEDGEFKEYCVSVMKEAKEKDAMIEKGLDVVHAGVLRLKEHAEGFQETLVVHDLMLQEQESLTEANFNSLQKLNNKLEKTLRESRSTTQMCIYLICCILLLGLVGGIFAVVRSITGKSI